MHSWFLIVVLVNPAEPAIEHHVTIHMPSEAACNLVKEEFVYGEAIEIDANDRTKLRVSDKQCMSATSKSTLGSV